MWMGFLSQERYSQQWVPSPYEIELPIVSVMEAMQGVSFTQSDGYTSLFGLVSTISQYLPIPLEITAPEDTPIQDVYVQNNNFREFLTIAERAERSTTNKYECETLYECVNAFCQYFGLSLHEYENSFYFVSLPDDIDYEDIDPQGNTRQSQWGSIDLSWFIVCGSSNEQSFSPIYRRIIGIFDTEKNKAEEIYSFEAFFKQFEVEGAYSNNSEMLFYGNDETWPYINGVHNAAHISSPDSGGQIMRMKGIFMDEDFSRDSAWTDCFFVHSQKNEISASGEPALQFYIPRKVYANADEFAAINIDFSLSAYYNATQSGDFIKHVYFKLKVGNYWLHSSTGQSGKQEYDWTTTESVAAFDISSGTISSNNANMDWRIEAQMNKISGFAVGLPNALSAGYYSVYFEFVANAEKSSDFGTYSAIGYLFKNLSINVLRAVNNPLEPTPDYDKNTVIRMLSGLYREDYNVSSKITTKRGTQFGAGMALTTQHEYVTTQYDQLGVVRRAQLLNKSREILRIGVRKHTQPIDTVTIEEATYGILSQSIEWRDDRNEIQIIKLD